MMKIQVIVTTMRSDPLSLPEEMNIQSDVIIAAQNGKTEYLEKVYDAQGHTAKVICTNTKGLGLNRNIAMAYADADWLIFADDDQHFIDGYEDIVLQAFSQHKDADAIKFYVESENKEKPLAYRKPDRFKKAKITNILSAGVVAMVVRRAAIQKKNITFPITIGAGTHYFSGEDSVFMKQMLDEKLKVYLSPILLATVKQEQSTWFSGYDEHYFITAGYVYGWLYGGFAFLAALRKAIQLRTAQKSFNSKQIYTLIRKGIEIYHNE